MIRHTAHPHTSLSLPAIESLSLNPILFTQVPVLDTVLAKLTSFIDLAPSWPVPSPTQAQVRQTLSLTVLPYLKARFPVSPKMLSSAKPTSSSLLSATPALLTQWSQVTHTLARALPVESLFPLVDMWRLALLDPAVGSWCAALPQPNGGGTPDPLAVLLGAAVSALRTPSTASAVSPRNYVLTVLRMLSNVFSNPPLARRLLSGSSTNPNGNAIPQSISRGSVTALLVPTLLHEDAAVRTAAASLAFNVAAYLQTGRVARVKGSSGVHVPHAPEDEDGDWEVEMVSAVVEAVDRETGSEEVGACMLSCCLLPLHLMLHDFPGSSPPDCVPCFLAPPLTVPRHAAGPFAGGPPGTRGLEAEVAQRWVW